MMDRRSGNRTTTRASDRRGDGVERGHASEREVVVAWLVAEVLTDGHDDGVVHDQIPLIQHCRSPAEQSLSFRWVRATRVKTRFTQLELTANEAPMTQSA